MYYFLIKKIADIDHIDNFHGFGLYDKKFIEILKKIETPNPYLRGLVAEFGFDMIEIEYTQSKRERGKSKGDFFIFVDSDVSVPAYWLTNIDKALSKHQADAFGGPDSYSDDFNYYFFCVLS